MPRTNATNENPSDGMTWRARRLSLPLPDLPIIALKREEALLQGYLPFAGFFLPHEYPMLPGFIKDLESAKREYCVVRDLKWAKGCELFAKNGTTHKPTLARDALSQACKTTEETKVQVDAGFRPPPQDTLVGVLAESQPARAPQEMPSSLLEASETKRLIHDTERDMAARADIR